MIITVTPNPSVDRTVGVDAIERGAVQRARYARVDAGGKGVNVSRALAANGTATRAVLPVGGSEGRLLQELLAAAGVDTVPVAIAGSVRANISVVEPDGTTTKINEPGPRLSREEQDALVDGVAKLATDGVAWVVGSGSLPPGTGAEFYARIVRVAHRHGSRVAVDTEGDALLAAAEAGADVLKPNDQELAAVVGRALPDTAAVVAAARELIARGAGQVVVSRGAQGALLVDAHAVATARAVVAAPVSTVGAGDCLLAGFLHAGSCDAAALATAVAWGAAAVGMPGSAVPGPADIAAVSVTLRDLA